MFGRMIEIANTNVTKPGISDNRAAAPVRFAVPAVCTINEAAIVLTLSRRHTAEMIATGRLRVKRLGKRVIVTRTELERVVGAKLA